MGGYHYWKGGDDDPRDQVGVDPTGPAADDPVPAILDQLRSSEPLTGGIVWPPESPKEGDAHDLPLHLRRERGSSPSSSSGAHVTGGSATAAGSAADPPDSAFDLDWNDDERTPPLLERVPWRIGVLDKDLIEDPDAIVEHASWIAGWYVHDCAELLGLVRELPPPEVAAGPPDLDHAIQAATDALDKGWVIQGELHRQHVARVAVEAAAPVLLQAMRDRLAALQGEYELTKARFTDFAEEAFERNRQHVVQVEELDRVVSLANAERNEARDRLADLEAEVQRLHGLILFALRDAENGWPELGLGYLKEYLDGPAAQEDGG